MRRAAFPAPRRLTAKDRARIFERDGGKCRCEGPCALVCLNRSLRTFRSELAAHVAAGTGREYRRDHGFKPYEPLYHVDHVVPLWAGGTNDDTNLVTLAAPCHRAKTRDEAGQRQRAGKRTIAPVTSQRLQRLESPDRRRPATGQLGTSAPADAGTRRDSTRRAINPRGGAGLRHGAAPSRWPKRDEIEATMLAARARFNRTVKVKLPTRMRDLRLGTVFPPPTCPGAGRAPVTRRQGGERVQVCPSCERPVEIVGRKVLPHARAP